MNCNAGATPLQHVIPMPPPCGQESERRCPIPGLFGKPRGTLSGRLSATSKDWRGMAKRTNARLDHEARHERPPPGSGEPEHRAAPARHDPANMRQVTNLFVATRHRLSSGCHVLPISRGRNLECLRVASHAMRKLRQPGSECHAACQFEICLDCKAIVGRQNSATRECSSEG